ncbi:hypothetical protein [Fulvimarina sp. MAC8]|uniref:hypothetical protein n=1 Tax=Fulvimarina sp. MAC8 TaxID=3162874 RepID=UPI0032F02165
MLAALAFAASSMAIPFESAPAPGLDAAPSGRFQNYEMSFEFDERQTGYQLNAVVFDLIAGSQEKTAVSSCRTIDIDSFSESDFGTPVLCNGVTYDFDIQRGSIVAVPMGGGKPVEVKRLSPGRAVVNGMPLLIKADR